MAKKKVLVFIMPASGHINPMLPVLDELVKSDQVDLVVYLTKEFRSKIDEIGAQYKQLENFDLAKMVDLQPFKNKRRIMFGKIGGKILEATAQNFKFIAKEIEEQKPDLILYDVTASHLKWSLKYYKKWYEIAKNKSESQRSRLEFAPTWLLPPMIGFSPAFALDGKIFPNKIEREQMVQISLSLIIDIVKMFFKTLFFSIRYRIGFGNMFGELFEVPDPEKNNTHFNIISVAPDVQARSHLFNPNLYKFVGSTVKDKKNTSLENKEPKTVIELLLNILPDTKDKSIDYNYETDFDSENDLVLVYGSLGTVFNNNMDIYMKIIEAFVKFDQEPDPTIKHSKIAFKNMRFILSTGEKVYDQLKDLVEKKKIDIPSNIIYFKSAPQIDILKKASIFLTHCGMNSTSEAIHFGCPMICIPLSEDQPLVGYRVADELGLGIRLDFTNMDYTQIRQSMHKILKEKGYFERSKRYAAISQRHDGCQEATSLILNFLKKH